MRAVSSSLVRVFSSSALPAAPPVVSVTVASTMTLAAVTAMATWHCGASQERMVRVPAS